jgi:hypothetical protein
MQSINQLKTSGWVRLFVLFAAGLWVSYAQAASGANQPQNLAALLQLMAQRTQAQANFVETKHLSVLTRPLVSRGILTYRAPDYLAKVTQHPQVERFIIQGQHISIQQGDKPARTLAIDRYPLLVALIDPLRATLAGNQQQLSRYYQLNFAHNKQGWELDLWPKSKALKKQVNFMQIKGSNNQITSMRINQTHGDYRLIQITPHAG